MVDQPVQTTLGALLEQMLPRCGAVTLRNAVGVIELRGEDLYLRRGRTLSLYHRDAERGEARSHAHLYIGGLSWARVVEKDGVTPRLWFWEDANEMGDKPPLSIAFPRFYDWDREPIPENQAHFDRWVSTHGRSFVLKPDEPLTRSRRVDAGFPGSEKLGGKP